MNVLIGFEESGTIRQAFRKLGHNAWSCDLQPARDGSAFHIKGDIYIAFSFMRWDLIILHPECTRLTVAGNHVYAKGKPKHNERLKAIRYTEELWLEAIEYADKVCLENPQGVLHTNTDLPKPQYIQPYQFGDDASKKTGLTLQGLPRLTPTKRIQGRMVAWLMVLNDGQTKLIQAKTN